MIVTEPAVSGFEFDSAAQLRIGRLAERPLSIEAGEVHRRVPEQLALELVDLLPHQRPLNRDGVVGVGSNAPAVSGVGINAQRRSAKLPVPVGEHVDHPLDVEDGGVAGGASRGRSARGARLGGVRRENVGDVAVGPRRAAHFCAGAGHVSAAVDVHQVALAPVVRDGVDAAASRSADTSAGHEHGRVQVEAAAARVAAGLEREGARAGQRGAPRTGSRRRAAQDDVSARGRVRARVRRRAAAGDLGRAAPQLAQPRAQQVVARRVIRRVVAAARALPPLPVQ